MPRVSTTVIIGFSLGLLLGTPPGPAFAGSPAEQLASQIDRVLAVLGDPAFRGNEQVGSRRQAVRKVTDELINWDEMGRRTLGAHWQTLSDDDPAVVQARVVGRDGHDGMPLDFAMLREGERWRVWDIRMQGTSMVGGYRAQFARLLQAESYDSVLRRLRERVESLEP